MNGNGTANSFDVFGALDLCFEVYHYAKELNKLISHLHSQIQCYRFWSFCPRGLVRILTHLVLCKFLRWFRTFVFRVEWMLPKWKTTNMNVNMQNVSPHPPKPIKNRLIMKVAYGICPKMGIKAINWNGNVNKRRSIIAIINLSLPSSTAVTAFTISATSASLRWCWPSITCHLNSQLSAVKHTTIHGFQRVFSITLVIKSVQQKIDKICNQLELKKWLTSDNLLKPASVGVSKNDAQLCWRRKKKGKIKTTTHRTNANPRLSRVYLSLGI